MMVKKLLENLAESLSIVKTALVKFTKFNFLL